MKEAHDDFAFEPIPGVPAPLPQGERLLWQGRPEWAALARQAFHVVKVGVYFLLLIVWQVASALRDGAPAAEIAASALWLAAVGAAAIGLLCALAVLYARSTIYTLTTKRVLIRSGLALPGTLNLPLALVENAAVTRARTGTGGIALEVVRPNRVAYLMAWPNARPWFFSNPQPMLRALADVDAAAAHLARALGGTAGTVPARQAGEDRAPAGIGAVA